MKKITQLTLAILLATCLVSCKSKQDKENLPFKTNYTVSYGTHSRHVLDIHTPENLDASDQRPFVLFIHGGGWIGGDKDSFSYMKSTVINLGYTYVSMNYRLLYNEVNYQGMTDDVGLALKFLKDNAKKYRLDPSQIALFGNSAGAYLALQYAYQNTSDKAIKFVVSEVGPTDFTDINYFKNEQNVAKLLLFNTLLSRNYQQKWLQDGNTDETMHLASPLYHVSNLSQPTLLSYGEKDDLVPYTNALSLQNKLTSLGITNDLINFENSGHSLDHSFDSHTKRVFERTFETYLKTYLNIKH